MQRITQFHEHKALVAAAQTSAGKFALWIGASVLLVWHDVGILMIASFALVLLFPDRRRQLLTFAAAGAVVEMILKRHNVELGPALLFSNNLDSIRWFRIAIQATVVILLITAAIVVARQFDQMPKVFRRFPLLTLHVSMWIALALSTLPQFRLLSSVPMLVWRLSYLFAYARRGKASQTSIKDHFFYLVPVFGGTSTPFGKGLDYLTRFEAQDREAAARSQLAGIKLLVLAIIWSVILQLVNALVYGQPNTLIAALLPDWTLGLPRLAQIIQLGISTPVPVAWLSMYLELIHLTMVLAVTGHVIVGCLRLLGFNVFRNTYRPLLAESIVEFWNRFYYYFKEVLVEFFFYPTFLRCSWAGQKLRLFLSVFAAAFAGNVYYHVLLESEPFIHLDFGAIWIEWGPRLVYCFLLALGIWLSMLRQRTQRESMRSKTLLTRLRAILGVWTFYSLIHIWNIQPREMDFVTRLNFIGSLVGL